MLLGSCGQWMISQGQILVTYPCNLGQRCNEWEFLFLDILESESFLGDILNSHFCGFAEEVEFLLGWHGPVIEFMGSIPGLGQELVIILELVKGIVTFLDNS